MTGTELDDYFRSTFEQKMLIRMPEREEDHLLPATRLLDKRREILEVNSMTRHNRCNLGFRPAYHLLCNIAT